MNPVCRDCPVAAKPAGCGYVAAGVPCQHPRYRDVWAAAEDRRKGEDSERASNFET